MRNIATPSPAHTRDHARMAAIGTGDPIDPPCAGAAAPQPAMDQSSPAREGPACGPWPAPADSDCLVRALARDPFHLDWPHW